MFEIELKFKVNGREVPSHAFIDAWKLELTENLKNALQQQKPTAPSPQVLRQQSAAPERRAYSVGEASDLLSVSKATIVRCIHGGKGKTSRLRVGLLQPLFRLT